jgi:hypothetical protein
MLRRILASRVFLSIGICLALSPFVRPLPLLARQSNWECCVPATVKPPPLPNPITCGIPFGLPPLVCFGTCPLNGPVNPTDVVIDAVCKPANFLAACALTTDDFTVNTYTWPSCPWFAPCGCTPIPTGLTKVSTDHEVCDPEAITCP